MPPPLVSESASQSTLNLLIGLWSHLSRKRRSQLGCLLIVMLASGMAELVSLGAVLPFLAVLSEPEMLLQQWPVKALASWFSWTTPNEIVWPFTIAFAIAALLTALIRLTNLWLNGRLAAAVGSDLSCEAYRRTLYQPYSVHLQRNSSDVITSITTQIGLTVVAINYFLQLITSCLVAIGLITGLVIIDASVALSAAILFSSTYVLLALNSRRELGRNSRRIAEATNQQLKALQEGLGAIRDVLLDGNQSTYFEIYKQADVPQRQLQAKNGFLASFPRFVLEALGLVAIALFGGVIVMRQGSGSAVIPLLGSLALGAQRLLPALQQIYSGWSTVKGFSESIYRVLEMLNQSIPTQVEVSEPFLLRQEIRLENVQFSYGSGQPNVLNSLNLEIRRGECIGLIGKTGSGKSTSVDMLMGLLPPTSGRIFVDGIDIYDELYPERLVAWRSAVTHVPQNIYLADCSIAENIAFGVPIERINFERVKLAAEQAQIANFIESSPEGYQTFVGERGIRLSGGQRQRIGIARALYKQARVMVLDEATSALDKDTEEAVMTAINSLSKSLTVIMIAHRLSTVQRCDRVIRLSKGLVVADGPPQEVLPTPNR